MDLYYAVSKNNIADGHRKLNFDYFHLENYIAEVVLVDGVVKNDS